MNLLFKERRYNGTIKGFKVRIYPTREQEQLMWQHIGACRFVWNYMLALQEKRYETGEKHLSAFDMINLLTPLKHDGGHEWLNDVSRKSLARTCQDLSEAYTRFFRKLSRRPKFKSRKRSEPKYPVRCDGFYFFDNRALVIERVGKVRYKTDFSFPYGTHACKFSDVRVSFVEGKWFVSFGMECENQTPILTDKPMGIDLGVKELAVVAFDDEPVVFHNINKSRKVRELERKKKHIQRNISRKYEQNRVGNRFVKTNNIRREEAKLRKVYQRLTGIRHNYLHQTTHTLVSMFPKRVVMEDLNVTGMMKNRHLSRAIQEQGFAEFIRQIKYKCEWLGIEFVQVDRFYPSSKTCSHCGAIKENLKLSDRTFVCEACGTVIDRDFNAALNLSRYAA